MKKSDWFLAGGILIIAAALLGYQMLSDGGDPSESVVVVTADGEEYGSYPLSEDCMVDIGETNCLVISEGTAVMEWADCPDQICVHHSPVSRNGESIICLPNEVVISIQGGDEPELDGMVQ